MYIGPNELKETFLFLYKTAFTPLCEDDLFPFFMINIWILHSERCTSLSCQEHIFPVQFLDDHVSVNSFACCSHHLTGLRCLRYELQQNVRLFHLRVSGSIIFYQEAFWEPLRVGKKLCYSYKIVLHVHSKLLFHLHIKSCKLSSGCEEGTLSTME